MTGTKVTPEGTVATGISLHIELMNWIDKERGDVSRSRFILRLIEKHYGKKFLK
jgi:hypothetical protein